MLKNYITLALRNLRKNRTFSIINLMGLGFGLSAAIAVLLYVQDEISYERFHVKAADIVRINSEAAYGDKAYKLGTAPNILAPFVKDRLPEVETATRVFANNFTGAANVHAGDKNYAEEQFYWADPSVFDVFTFQMTAGAATHALDNPNTAIINASTARRYFGAENPIGKTIRVDNANSLEITGVFADFPANTHLPMDIVGAFQSIRFGKTERQSWGNASFYTYLLTHPGTDIPALESKLQAVVTKDAPEGGNNFKFKLIPLDKIHLYSGDITTYNVQPYGDIRQVRILSGLAILLLLIACINYMNLATAQSQRRAKEVSLSKTLGASGSSLALRFYVETALLTLLGICSSLLILRLGLPVFNELSGKQLHTGFLSEAWFWAGAGAIWLVVTLVAGAYPAVYLSSFSPYKVLRQTGGTASRGSGLFRKGLVVFQFFISTALIFSTLIFYKQLDFIRNKKLGYAPEQIVALKISSAENKQQIEALESEISRLSAVKGTALTQTFPGREGSGRTLSHLNAPENEGISLTTCRARPEIFSMLDIKMLAGQPMRKPAPEDTITEIVINRASAVALGWTPDDAIGKQVEANLQNAVVTGVVEDFHFGSMHDEIGCYAFHNARTEGLDFMLVKLNTTRLSDAMRDIESVFQRTMSSSAFDYVFLDEHLDNLYRKEQKTAKVAFVFAGLAIFIACLGLFALAAFAAERRTKEIGVRKVLGASVTNVTALLTGDFLKLVVVSIVIASPVAYYLMHKWLANFAYHIDIQWWMFVLTGLAAISIAFLTVSFQSVKAAMMNPVKTLRSE